ncbi:hypothetical protein BJ165DRAFT_1486339 [Panaeolus papilionaceus]|nr:hypothetical protein BJ165DRAFT_1486339 [Panaeolus papilionaceus]
MRQGNRACGIGCCALSFRLFLLSSAALHMPPLLNYRDVTPLLSDLLLQWEVELDVSGSRSCLLRVNNWLYVDWTL